jgi:glycerate-2-kinase
MDEDAWTSGPFTAGDTDNTRRLRGHAGVILRDALAAVDPSRLVEAALRERPLPPGQVRVIAFGKAAAAMARGAISALGSRVRHGIVVVPHGTVQDVAVRVPLEIRTGGHPEPDADSVAAGRAVLDVARRTGPDEVLLALVSGGGSAIVALPPNGVSLDDVVGVTRALMHAGAPIDALNVVRKHLDALKGGRLARASTAGATVALLLSDVPGDRADVIASGPFAPDPTTIDDAIAVLREYGVWSTVPDRVRSYLERAARSAERDSPAVGDPCFDRVTSAVIGGNGTALAAAARTAASLGYRVELDPEALVGEARDVGRRFVVAAGTGDVGGRSGASVPPGDARGRFAAVTTAGSATGEAGSASVASAVCRLAGGETTVTVRGGGRGGRNQELVLGAALAIDGVEAVVIASVGTDGIDGPTGAAGAIADGATIRRARERGLDAGEHLTRNDAFAFFEPLDDLIVTGPTGTNVMDVQLALVATERTARSNVSGARSD